MKSFSAILLIAVAIRFSVASQNLDSTHPSVQTSPISNSDNKDSLKTPKEPTSTLITGKEPTSTSITTTTQKVFDKKVSKRHAFGLKDEDSQKQEQGTEKPSKEVTEAKETKDETNGKQTSISASTQKTIKKKVSKRHASGLKDEHPQKQEKGTEKPSQDVNKAKETKEKTNNKETSISTTTQKVIQKNFFKRHALGLKDEDSQKQEQGTEKPSKKVNEAKETKDKTNDKETSISTSTQKTIIKKVSKRHAFGLKDEDAQKQEKGTAKPSQDVNKAKETKDKTNNNETSISTTTHKVLQKVFKRHAFGPKDEDSKKQEQGTEKPSKEVNEAKETKDKTNDKETSTSTSTQKTIQKKVSKRHAFGLKDEDPQKLEKGTEKPSQDVNKAKEAKDETNNKDISITTSTQKTIKNKVFKRHAFGLKDEDAQKQEKGTTKPSQDVNKAKETKDKTNNNETSMSTTTHKVLQKKVFKRHAFGPKDEDSKKQEQGTEKPSKEVNEAKETKDKTNDKETSTSTSTQKTIQKKVSKRHAFGLKDEDPQKQEKGTEKLSQDVNKAKEAKDNTNNKDISITTSTQKTIKNKVFKRHAFGLTDEDAQKQEKGTGKPSQDVNKAKEAKDESHNKDISITTSTQKTIKNKVFKRHAFGLKDENAQKQEKGTEKPSQHVNKAKETKDKTNNNETSISTTTQKVFQKKVFKRHAFGLKDEDSQKQEQGTEKPSKEVNEAKETKDKTNDKETSTSTSTQKTIKKKVSKRHAFGLKDEDAQKQEKGTQRPSQDVNKAKEAKDETNNKETSISTSTQKTIKNNVSKRHAFGLKDEDAQKQEKGTEKPSQDVNKPKETKDKTNDKETSISTSTQKTIKKKVSKRHAFGLIDEDAQKQEKGTEKPSQDVNKAKETKDKTNKKETSIATTTQKVFQKKVFKRHAFGLKDEDSQKQKQETEKPSQEVNKAKETKDKTNDKEPSISTSTQKVFQKKVSKRHAFGLKDEDSQKQEQVTERPSQVAKKTTSIKLSDAFDLASRVHVKEEQDKKNKKNVFAKLNDQVKIGKRIVDSAKKIENQKTDNVENSEVKTNTFNTKNYFIGPNKKISSTQTQSLSDNKNNNVVFGLDKPAEENTYGIEKPGLVKRNVNMQSPIKKVNRGDKTVKKPTGDDESSTDLPDFVGKEVERLGQIIDETDGNKHINKNLKNEEVKNMKGGKIKREDTFTPKTIENKKMESKQVKGDGKQTTLGIKN